jgi:6-phosphogluconolactonase
MAEFRSFSGPEEVAEVLSAEVAALVRQGVAERGAASLIVPGGRTPALFLSKLSHRALAWDKVQVTGSDERWVDVSSPDSNEALVRRTLLAHEAAGAEFVSLYSGAATPAGGLAEVETRVRAMARPFDAVVMGMGDDGHFASLFPGEPALAIGLDLSASALCVAAKGPAGGPPRLSLTLSCLANARHIYILATGGHKRDVWQSAADQPADILPAAALHRLTGIPVDFMWCP